MENQDLEYAIDLTPDQAATGVERSFSWQDGGVEQSITMRIPGGVVDGTRLRFKGKGRVRPDGTRGDLYLRLEIATVSVPFASEAKASSEASRAERVSVRASFELTRDDIFRANLSMLSRIPGLMPFYVLICVMFGLVLIPEAIRKPELFLDLRFYFLLAIVVFPPAITYWQARQLVGSLRPGQLRKTYVFEAERFFASDGLSEGWISWEAVPSVVETPRGFHLFLQKNIFHLVPITGFSGPGDIVAVRGIIRTALGSKAALR